MAIDTPATIAILGAGPIGLETALYARFLGYDVILFEQGSSVANHVRHWGHVELFTPFQWNHSSLGRRAIEAQNADFAWPADDALLTGVQWLQSYLEPLSQVDLLRGNIRLNTKVVSVGRESYLKSQMVPAEERFDELFSILVTDQDGNESLHTADIVVDTTGTYSVACHFGPGGMPALGETALQHDSDHTLVNNPATDASLPYLSYRLPDLLNSQRNIFAGQTTLVVGRGFSAATNIDRLVQLKQEVPATEIHWLVRAEPESADQPYPMRRLDNDSLPNRDALAERVNRAVAQGEVVLHSATQLARIQPDNDGKRWQVEITGDPPQQLGPHAILANVGFRGDWRLCDEMQVHRCYASEGPMAWAATLASQSSQDCTAVTAGGPNALITTEPNFYVLGAKSYGRWSNFLFQNGLKQVRDLFQIIGDRDSLDLYAQPPGSSNTA